MYYDFPAQILQPHFIFFRKTAQRYNIFSRYANKILILIANVLIIVLIFVLLSASLPMHSLPNLKIYLFMSKKVVTLQSNPIKHHKSNENFISRRI